MHLKYFINRDFSSIIFFVLILASVTLLGQNAFCCQRITWKKVVEEIERKVMQEEEERVLQISPTHYQPNMQTDTETLMWLKSFLNDILNFWELE